MIVNKAISLNDADIILVREEDQIRIIQIGWGEDLPTATQIYLTEEEIKEIAAILGTDPNPLQRKK